MKLKPNALFQSNCLALLERIDSEQATLVYLDPPLNSGTDFLDDNQKSQYKSKYLLWIAKVIQQSYRITKRTGSIVIHTDPNVHSYFRLLLEESFPDIEFSEIVLKRKGRFYASNLKPYDEHEIFLVCRKSRDSIWNQPTRPLSDDEIKQRYPYEDSLGLFTIADLTVPSSRGMSSVNFFL